MLSRPRRSPGGACAGQAAKAWHPAPPTGPAATQNGASTPRGQAAFLRRGAVSLDPPGPARENRLGNDQSRLPSAPPESREVEKGLPGGIEARLNSFLRLCFRRETGT